MIILKPNKYLKLQGCNKINNISYLSIYFWLNDYNFYNKIYERLDFFLILFKNSIYQIIYNLTKYIFYPKIKVNKI